MKLLLSLPLVVLLALRLAAAESAPAPAATRVLSPEQFVTAVAADLASHFSLEGELQLELLRPWTAPERAVQSWQVEITEYPAAPASSMMLRCRVRADGTVSAEQTLVVRAALWRDAWYARQPLVNGTRFDPVLLDARRTDFLRDRDALPASAGDGSYDFARGVLAGRLLGWRDVARRPLVRKGEVVDVAATDGLLTVNLKAVALQNGAQGETITVRNPDSRKDFSASVIDEKRVQVRF
jgi:flagella basal body P-ring formation protein FlgA